MKVSFDRLEEKIKQREKEIDSTRQGIAGLLIVNSKLQAIVDPDRTEQANGIMKRLNSLKKVNENDRGYIAYCHAVFEKHRIDSSFEVNIDQMKSDLSKNLEVQMAEAKNMLIRGDTTGAEYDELSARLKAPIDSRIAELIAVESELSAFRAKQTEEVKA